MLNIKIDKQYKLITEWSELSFEKSIEIASMIDQMPRPFKQRFFNEKKQDKIETEDISNYLEFMIQYISALNDIPSDVLRKVKPKNGVDINYIFELCCKFLAYPLSEECEMSEFILLNGEKLYPVKKDIDSMGRTSNFQNADFATYSAGMMIQTIIDHVLSSDFRMKELTMLAACIYRPMTRTRKWFRTINEPEVYDAKKVDVRALKMMQLPASSIYGAYFFLLKQQRKSLADTQNSLNANLKRKMKNPMLRLRVTMASLRWLIVGYFMRMRLHVTEYLTSKE
jgi:hypothetical protein